MHYGVYSVMVGSVVVRSLQLITCRQACALIKPSPPSPPSPPSQPMEEDAELLEPALPPPPPTEAEQERLALYWAMEEANAPRGWEDDKELDYTGLAEGGGGGEGEELSQSKNSGER